MRRMYSEQELTKIIHDVVGNYIEDGAFDESIASAVDAYLVEHPVDITALEGKDVELNSLDATGLVTGGEIVEKMSGYSFSPVEKENISNNISYAGVVKNGNKLTMTIVGQLTRSGDVTGNNTHLGDFTLPNDIAQKLVPHTIGTSTNALRVIGVSVSTNSFSIFRTLAVGLYKVSTNQVHFIIYGLGDLVLNTIYDYTAEVTFLLSENLIPQE